MKLERHIVRTLLEVVVIDITLFLNFFLLNPDVKTAKSSGQISP